MATTPVRWFHSGMANAPVLSGTAGSLVALLDACLIDGFDSRSVNSISVSGGVATVTISAGNPFDVHAVIRVAGVTGALSALNDDWRTTSAAASTLTFACPGIADGSATGTITCKRSPAGWTKAFSATNKAAYRAASVAATRLFLRVDDNTDPLKGRVRGYESMTDVDTGTGPFPKLTTLADNAFIWAKSDAAGSASRPWAVVCDDAMIYLFTKFNTSASYTNALYWFGDAVSYIPADAFHCTIAATCAASPSYPGHILGTMRLNSTSSGPARMARKADQVTQEPSFSMMAPYPVSGFAMGNINDFPSYPAPDGALNVFYPVPITNEQDRTYGNVPIRGHMPGVAMPWHGRPLAHLDTVVADDGPLAGRTLMLFAADDNANIGRIAIDITGPWR